MKNKKDETYKIILTVVGVLMLVALVVGGTFAWWTWRSSTNTTVNITVAGGTYTLDGGGNITSQSLIPTDQCNGNYAIKRTITAKATNTTNTAMTAKVQLNPTTFPTVFNSTYLKWTISDGTNACSTTSPVPGTFSGVVQGTPMDIAEFTVGAGASVEKTYYLFIWLDSSYSPQPNIGTTVSDPMQNKSFTLSLTGTMTNDPNA